MNVTHISDFKKQRIADAKCNEYCKYDDVFIRNNALTEDGIGHLNFVLSEGNCANCKQLDFSYTLCESLIFARCNNDNIVQLICKENSEEDYNFIRDNQ